MDLFTKNGLPLQVSSDMVYSRSGKVVGRIRGNKVYGPDGHYIGTIVGNRLVYRSTDRTVIISPFVAANRAGFSRANRSGSAIWGEEPKIPD